MKTLLLCCCLFFITACQSATEQAYQNTRIILQLNNPIAQNPQKVLDKLAKSISLKQIKLIRQSSARRLIVEVKSSKPITDWLKKLRNNALIDYAEIDYKKHF